VSLDSLADSAASALHRQVTGRDLDVDLARVQRASRRRTRRQLFGCVVIVVVLVVGWLVVRPVQHSAAPAVPTPTHIPLRLHTNGPLMGFGNPVSAGAAGTSVCRVVAVDVSNGRATAQPSPPPGPCDGSLAWSPDGRDLAELTSAGQIKVQTPVGGASRTLADCVRCNGLSWSPDGTALAAGTPDGILVLDVQTGSSRRLLGAGANVWSPSWSPDGQQLAYARTWGPFLMSLDVVGADGSGQRTLLAAGNLRGIPAHVAWSPTGRQIAVLALGAKQGAQLWPVRVLSVDPRDGAVTVLHDSGGSCYCLGASPSLAWAPDGSALATWMPTLPKDKHWWLYTMRSDGSGFRRVPGDPISVFIWWRADS
jgi:Tol biopolymer transport system component